MPGTRRARVRGLLLDTEPLRRDRDYRLLWTGQAVTGVGTQITRLALPYQVYEMTGSTLAIAALTLFQLVPILSFALAGGSLADAVDRRRLLLATQLGLLTSSLALAGLSLSPSPPLLAIYVVAFFAAGLSAVDQPARLSSIPRLVPAERLPSALALNQINQQAAKIVGPAIGGLLIAAVGLTGAYLVDAVSFTASLAALTLMRPLPALGEAARPGLRAIVEGLRFVRRRREILASFVIDLNAMILAMPTALFPAIALDVFRVGPQGLGLMSSAPAVGAFLAAVFSGWVARVEQVGRAVVVCVIGWCAAMTGFGVATVAQEFALGPTPMLFALAASMLALAGGWDVLSAVFRTTMVQLGTPDELRGRVMSIHTLVVTSGPRLGDIQSAVLGAIIGPGQAVVAGGLASLAGVAVVARLLPELPSFVLRRPRIVLPERPPSSEVGVGHPPAVAGQDEVPGTGEPTR